MCQLNPIRPFWRLSALLVTLLVTATAGAAGRSQVDNLCSLLLASPGYVAAKKVNSLSQAKRLKGFLDGLSAAQKTEIFNSLKGIDFEKLNLQLSTGRGLEKLDKQIEANPELATVLKDLAEFGHAFPGIFATASASELVDQILDVITTDEGKVQGTTSADLLASQTMTARLSTTINSTLVNLIQQMDVEQAGMRFNRTFMQNLWYKIKLFILPAYSRVRNLLQTGQEYQMQLSRLRLVDRIVINAGLSNARAMGLSSEELARLTFLVLNSPDEIGTIEKDLKKIFGRTFAIGKPVEIGKFELYQSNSKANEIDFGALWEKFDTANIGGLDTLNEILSAASARKGGKAPGVTDYQKEEVQLRYEAADRRIGHYASEYGGWTGQDSNESYTVERRHTRQVPDGKDSKGNTTYRTEVYYVSDSVTPSFENILSDSFDKGDRGVTGLSNIRDRAEKVVAAEAGPRKLMAAIDDFVELVNESYSKAVTTGESKEKLVTNARILVKRVNEAIPAQQEYLKMTNSQIKAQYDEDIAENFRARNGWMLSRLENANAYLAMVLEGLRRNQVDLTPAYELMDFTDWLRNLRQTRNRNYTIKGLIATVTSGSVAYVASPEVQTFVQTYTGVSYHDVLQLMSSLGQINPF